MDFIHVLTGAGIWIIAASLYFFFRKDKNPYSTMQTDVISPRNPVIDYAPKETENPGIDVSGVIIEMEDESLPETLVEADLSVDLEQFHSLHPEQGESKKENGEAPQNTGEIKKTGQKDDDGENFLEISDL